MSYRLAENLRIKGPLYGLAIFWLAVALLATACFHPKPPRGVSEEVERDAAPTRRSAIEVPKFDHETPQGDFSVADMPIVAEEQCRSIGIPQIPHYDGEIQIMFTRIVNECRRTDGSLGINDDSGVLAMAFPCTGGSGPVSWRGNRWNPHMLSFEFSNDCPMVPANLGEVKNLVQQLSDEAAEVNVMALHPFAVQYWELIEYSDAGVGAAVELRSEAAIRSGWRSFQQGGSYRVRLFGRENAWVPSDAFFQVDAEIQHSGAARFTLVIETAKALSSEELKAVAQRCASLQPPRNCAQVF